MKEPFIIAEIAQGYEGSEKLVNLFARSAAAVGADAVKFQIFYADELALPDYKYYALFKSLELPFEVWGAAAAQAHKYGMEFYSDVFGLKSLRNLMEVGVDGFKIHSTDINNKTFLAAVAKAKKKIFLSTGGCELEEIRQALKILNKCDVTLMHGFQAEPTELLDNNLNRINTLKKEFDLPVGFQDHTAGDSELASFLPFVALGLGARVVEKHLTLSRIAETEDYISALSPEEFKSWVRKIKNAYLSLGEETWKLSDKERSYRTKVRRAVCSVRGIKKGEVIKESDAILKRTSNNEAVFDLSFIIGKKAKSAISENAVISKRNVI